MKKVSIVIAGLAIMANLGQAQASMGGINYNRGTYECLDDKGELKGNFTFGEPLASLFIKGEPLTLECTPAKNADQEALQVFVKRFVTPADVCTGKAKKGTVLVGTTNSMGVVQMRAFLLDSAGDVDADARMNCKQVQTDSGSGW